jgi:hypothetical protein
MNEMVMKIEQKNIIHVVVVFAEPINPPPPCPALPCLTPLITYGHT